MSPTQDSGGTTAGGHEHPAQETSGAGGSTATTTQDRGPSLLRSMAVFLREIVIVVALAVVLSLIAKTWLVQTFWIPSESMMSTLIRDDRVLVSKLTPGPFDLERGDIVVFADPGGWLDPNVAPLTPGEGIGEVLNTGLRWVGLLPEDKGNHLIKRIIGMPGDHVTCCTAEGKIAVNGTPITEPYLHPGDAPSEVKFDIRVPAGKVWVMGDHRSDSRDSRYQDGAGDLGEVGSVPISDIVGKAFTVVWPLNRFTWLSDPKDTFAQVPAPSQAPAKSATPSATGTP